MSKTFALLGALLVSTSFAAYANAVNTIPAGGNWSNMVTPNDASGAFWDNKSLDSTLANQGQCNVGYWLTADSWPLNTCKNLQTSQGLAPNYDISDLQFLRGASGIGAATGWEMQAAGPNAVQLRVEVAGFASANIFGYYTYNASGNKVLNQLFAGSAAPSASIVNLSLAANQLFGFYICPNGNCGNPLFSGTDTSVANVSGKFALFREVPAGYPQTYWIGVEDTAGSGGPEGLGDFNDMIVKLTVVPEPGFYGLLSLGIGGLFLAVRRRKQS